MIHVLLHIGIRASRLAACEQGRWPGKHQMRKLLFPLLLAALGVACKTTQESRAQLDGFCSERGLNIVRMTSNYPTGWIAGYCKDPLTNTCFYLALYDRSVAIAPVPCERLEPVAH